MKKAIPVIMVLIILVVSLYYVLFLKDQKSDKTGISVSGTIEVTQVDLSFTAGGRILEIIPQEGDRVSKGELLAYIDAEDINQSIEIAEKQKNTYEAQIPVLDTQIKEAVLSHEKELILAQDRINEAKFNYESLVSGNRKEDIEKSQLAVNQAKIILENDKKEYERAENLYSEGAMPAQQRDRLKTVWLTSEEKYKQSLQTYELLKTGAKKEDISAVYSKLEQAKANYELVKTRELKAKQLREQKQAVMSQITLSKELKKQADLNKKHIKLYSPLNGVVMLRLRENGEVVAPGIPVFTVADINNAYLKAYVSESDLGKVKLGQSVKVKTDSYPDKTYEGKIYYISDLAEFTPKTLTTKEDRVKLVYKIKVELNNESQELKQGMIADGTIDL